jgi:hypothetical protein
LARWLRELVLSTIADDTSGELLEINTSDEVTDE